MGMIFLSEEDVDIPALVESWLKRQEPAMQNNLRSWMENYFHRSLQWVLDYTAVVASTKVGLVLTALSHLRNVTVKGEFVVGLIRGMGSNLELDKRSAFAREVFGWAGDRAPDPRAPLDCFWNKATSSYMPYLPDNKPVNPEEMSVRSPPVVQTVDVQRNRDLVMPWLEHMEPTIVVGPEGCGKTLLLTQCFKRLKSASVSTIHCSAQTAAAHVMQVTRHMHHNVMSIFAYFTCSCV
jgi:dynein heavy chain 2